MEIIFKTKWLGVAALALMVVACKSSMIPTEPRVEASNAKTGPFKLSSKDFAEGGAIPQRFSCNGADISPALEWSGAPAGTESYALIVEDPDAPSGTFTHWLIYEIPKGASELKQGEGSAFTQGNNDFGKSGYGGPCPPSGVHHYVFKLFALSQKLGLPAGASKQKLESAMQGKVLAQTSLTGTFAK